MSFEQEERYLPLLRGNYLTNTWTKLIRVALREYWHRHPAGALEIATDLLPNCQTTPAVSDTVKITGRNIRPSDKRKKKAKKLAAV